MAEIVKRLAADRNINLVSKNSDPYGNGLPGSISLVNPKDTNIYEVTARSNDPNEVEALANVAAEVFVEKMAETKSADLNKAVEFLEGQMKTVEERLHQSEKDLNSFKEKENLTARVSTGAGYVGASLLNQLGDLQEELSRAQSEKELTQAQLNSVKAMIVEKTDRINPTDIDSLSGSLTPQIEQLQTRISDWRMELATLLETNTEKHPKVLELNRKIEEAQKMLQTEISKMIKERGTSADPLSEWYSLMQQAVQLNLQLKTYERKEILVVSKIERFKQTHPNLVDKYHLQNS